MRLPVARQLLPWVGVVVAAVVVAVVVGLLPTGTASAHTELDFALPAEGTTVAQPVSEISIGFTDVVALIGNGFEVLDPQGNLVVPFAVTDDDKIFRLQLDPPLAGGPVVVSYHVLSLDGHEVEGQVSFTAAAEPPPTTEPTTQPATIPPATAPVATTAPPSSASTAAPAPSTLAPTSTGPSVTTDPTTADADGDESSDSNRNLLIAALVAVVLGSVVVLVVRSRRTP